MGSWGVGFGAVRKILLQSCRTFAVALAPATWLSDYSYPAAPQVPVVSARTIARRRSRVHGHVHVHVRVWIRGNREPPDRATPSPRIKAVRSTVIMTLMKTNTDDGAPVHASHLHQHKSRPARLHIAQAAWTPPPLHILGGSHPLPVTARYRPQNALRLSGTHTTQHSSF